MDLARLPVGWLIVASLASAFVTACNDSPAAALPKPPPARTAEASPYRLGFGAVLGGTSNGQARDVAVDREGNAYLAGGSAAREFPRTVGPTHQGWLDVFVVKVDREGELVWSRLIGGPNYDRAYAVEVDAEGYVYVGGRAGPGYPVTEGVLQQSFGGDANPNWPYARQDGFVTKLSPDGRDIVWSTYFGGGDRGFLRDIDIDDEGNVYVAMTEANLPQPHITKGSFAPELPAGRFGSVAKISADGKRLLWGAYLGGRDGKPTADTPSVRVLEDGSVAVVSTCRSASMPTTEGALDRVKDGKFDMHLARISADGSRLLFATYIGGSGSEYGDTHNLAIAPDGSIVVAATTTSEDFPVTAGAAQTKYGGSGGGFNQIGDGFVAKISPDGARLVAASYIGGHSGEGIEGVATDAAGNVYISCGTYSPDFPSVGGLSKATAPVDKKPDACLTKFSPDLGRLLFSSRLGGSGWDLGLAVAVAADGSVYMGGETRSEDFPMPGWKLARPKGEQHAALLQLKPSGQP